jgi:hypothetical protein
MPTPDASRPPLRVGTLAAIGNLRGGAASFNGELCMVTGPLLLRPTRAKPALRYEITLADGRKFACGPRHLTPVDPEAAATATAPASAPFVPQRRDRDQPVGWATCAWQPPPTPPPWHARWLHWLRGRQRPTP